jgi:hypothetical protein
MKLLLTGDEYNEIKAELKAANIRATSRPIRTLSAKCYELKFPVLTGGVDQMKSEKILKEKLAKYTQL